MNVLNNAIKNAFSKDTKSHVQNINKFQKCGDETIKLINDLNPNLVLDLGCGDNQYKHHIKNLVGIDLVSSRADIIGDISYLNFPNESVDACLCYGSINFGNEELINKQLCEMFRILKPGGLAVFRGNMNEQENEIYYGWSKEKVYFWTDYFNVALHTEPDIVYRLKKNGCINYSWDDQVAAKTGYAHRSITRLYWIWKNDRRK
jgi:SAM-dependent methyltransferase